MDAMTDLAMKAHKEMAMKHMDMANAAMKDSKTDECVMHMGETMGASIRKCSKMGRYSAPLLALIREVGLLAATIKGAYDVASPRVE